MHALTVLRDLPCTIVQIATTKGNEVKLKWTHSPRTDVLKEAYEAHFEDVPLSGAFHVHYSNGWTIIYPKELSGHKSNDVAVLKAQVEQYYKGRKS